MTTHTTVLPFLAHRFDVALTVVTSAALLWAGAAATTASEVDADAKSPWTIPFDPNGVAQARNAYVSGGPIAVAPGPFAGTNINMLLGANTFYDHGYTGANAVIANIEAGHLWNAHETMTHVQQIPNHLLALNEVDLHATAVGMILGGRRAGSNSGTYQEGLAPDAQLYSGAIASQWNGQRYALSFSIHFAALFDQYRRAFNLGVNTSGRRADVINSSWGEFGSSASASGTTTIAIGLDALAHASPNTLLVVAAGNSGPGPNTVWAPASGYNILSVGSLGPDPDYNAPSNFSSAGPNNYADPVNGTVSNARQVVHIAAPGEQLSTAWYGGETGGNGTTDNPAVSGPGPTGPPIGPQGGPDYYGRGGWAGTSFASPTVAGGTGLLYDASYDAFPANDHARDARVMKAVLMNSADKTVGWDNGQIAHPNGNGGSLTTQGLDNRVGTGRMNLHAAFDQFLVGTTDIPATTSGNLGPVRDIGWDFGNVVSPATNDYYFDAPLLGGSTITATLTWFRDRQINSNNAVFDVAYDDLNLELWNVVNGVSTTLVGESRSRFNNTEHFSFQLPSSGDYALRVRWLGKLFDTILSPDQEDYGLAWSAVYQDAGDFDDDGDYDCDDIDDLVAEIVAGTNRRDFDLTGDHRVNVADRNAWLAVAGAANLASGNPYLLGDANLDGSVDGSDFGIWNRSKFTNVSAWCSGDFSVDGVVDGSDFGIWNANKFQSSLRTIAVPEPTGVSFILIGWICVNWTRIRTKRTHPGGWTF